MLGIRLRDSRLLELQCPHCDEAKMSADAVGTPLAPTTQLLGRVFFDSVGPFPASHQDGFQYFHTAHVPHIGYTEIKHPVNRGEIAEWVNYWIENTHARHYPLRIVEVRADGAGELTSAQFRPAREAQGITLITGAPHAHHHQASVERPQCTIQEMSRTMRSAAGMRPETGKVKVVRQVVEHANVFPFLVTTAWRVATRSPTR